MSCTFFPERGQPTVVYVADDERISHFAAEVMSLAFAPKLPVTVQRERLAAYRARQSALAQPLA